ncbi:MAG TPA: hypothetical protein VGY77_02005 [Gemmataceae bacterium]|jgi:hypothetical protein|nr:hypothetical protein [Gemmataceae bacterium]
MAMASYPVLCHRPECGRPAIYKIAARWSDGVTQELKTYSLCCAECLAECFRESCARQARCRKGKNEILDAPSIFMLERGKRDRILQRLTDLEEKLRSERA